MSGAWSLLALAGTVALCVTFIICVAESDNCRDKGCRDWREDWCCPECYADHKAQGPCEDCPARRTARRGRR